MANAVISDRIRESTNVEGTGNVTLLGTSNAFQTFTSGVGIGSQTWYCIVDYDNNAWEAGYGTLVSSSLFTRDAVYDSSNNNNIVSFLPGRKIIFVPLPAKRTLAYPLDSYFLQISGSTAISGNLVVLGSSSISGGIPASQILPGTMSGNFFISGNVSIPGTASVGVLYTLYTTSSVIFQSGSTIWGDTLDDTHRVTGSLLVTGSTIIGNLLSSGTGSFTGGRINFGTTLAHIRTDGTYTYLQSPTDAGGITIGSNSVYINSASTALIAEGTTTDLGRATGNQFRDGWISRNLAVGVSASIGTSLIVNTDPGGAAFLRMPANAAESIARFGTLEIQTLSNDASGGTAWIFNNAYFVNGVSYKYRLGGKAQRLYMNDGGVIEFGFAPSGSANANAIFTNTLAISEYSSSFSTHISGTTAYFKETAGAGVGLVYEAGTMLRISGDNTAISFNQTAGRRMNLGVNSRIVIDEAIGNGTVSIGNLFAVGANAVSGALLGVDPGNVNVTVGNAVTTNAPNFVLAGRTSGGTTRSYVFQPTNGTDNILRILNGVGGATIMAFDGANGTAIAGGGAFIVTGSSQTVLTVETINNAVATYIALKSSGSFTWYFGRGITLGSDGSFEIYNAARSEQSLYISSASGHISLSTPVTASQSSYFNAIATFNNDIAFINTTNAKVSQLVGDLFIDTNTAGKRITMRPGLTDTVSMTAGVVGVTGSLAIQNSSNLNIATFNNNGGPGGGGGLIISGTNRTISMVGDQGTSVGGLYIYTPVYSSDYGLHVVSEGGSARIKFTGALNLYAHASNLTSASNADPVAIFTTIGGLTAANYTSSGSSAQYAWNDSSGGSNGKYWRITTGAAVMRLQMLNDAANIAVDVWSVTRADVTASAMVVSTPLFQVGAGGGNSQFLVGPSVPSADNSSRIELRSSNVARNWQIDSNTLIGSTLSFTPSTVVGGTSYTTPVVKMNTAGVIISGSISMTATDSAIDASSIQFSLTSGSLKTITQAKYGFLYVTENTVTGAQALYALRNSTSSIIWQNASTYGTAKNNPSTFNVYWDVGTSSYIIQQGATGSTCIFVIRHDKMSA